MFRYSHQTSSRLQTSLAASRRFFASRHIYGYALSQQNQLLNHQPSFRVSKGGLK